MARRLMKALEDLSLQYDQTVRNSETVVIQFSYGDDGLNPQMMERDDRPVEYNRILENIQGQYKHIEENPVSGEELRQMIGKSHIPDNDPRQTHSLVKRETFEFSH